MTLDEIDELERQERRSAQQSRPRLLTLDEIDELERAEARAARTHTPPSGQAGGPPAVGPQPDPAAVELARQSWAAFRGDPFGSVSEIPGALGRGAVESLSGLAGAVEAIPSFGGGTFPIGTPGAAEAIPGALERSGVLAPVPEPTSQIYDVARGAGRMATDAATYAVPAAIAARGIETAGPVSKILIGNYLSKGQRLGLSGAEALSGPALAREAAKDVAYGASAGAGATLGEAATGDKWVGPTAGMLGGAAIGVGATAALGRAGRGAATFSGSLGRRIGGSERALATLEAYGAGTLAKRLKANRDLFYGELGRQRAAEAFRRAAGNVDVPLEPVVRNLDAATAIEARYPGARLNTGQATGSVGLQTMLDDRARRHGAFREALDTQREGTESALFGALQAQTPPQPGGIPLLQKLVRDSLDVDRRAAEQEIDAISQSLLGMRRTALRPGEASTALDAGVQRLVDTTQAHIDELYRPFNEHGRSIQLPGARERLQRWIALRTGRQSETEVALIQKATQLPAVRSLIDGGDVMTFTDIDALRKNLNSISPDALREMSYQDRQFLSALRGQLDDTLDDAMASGRFVSDADPDTLRDLYQGVRETEQQLVARTGRTLDQLSPEELRSGVAEGIPGRYREARAAFREQRDVLAPEGRGLAAIDKATGVGISESKQTGAGEVAQRLLGPGAGSQERVAQFGRMRDYAMRADPGLADQLDEGARTYLLARAYDDAGFREGIPNPVALQGFRESHRDALKAFPDVDRHLADVGTATKFFEQRQAEVKQRLKAYEKSVAQQFVDAPLDKAADAILDARGMEPVAAAQQILDRAAAGGNRDRARRGLGNALSESLLREAGSVRGGTAADAIAGGKRAFKFDRLLQQLDANAPVLRSVWGDERYRTVRQIAATLDTNKVATRSRTMRELGEAEKRQVQQKVAKWAGGVRDFLDTGGIPFGEKGARMLDRMTEDIPYEYAEQFIERALLDPSFARVLLSEGDEIVRADTIGGKAHRAWLYSLTADAMRDTNQKENAE